MSSRLNWDRAKRDSAAARNRLDTAAKRSRPHFKTKPWVVIVQPWENRHPPKKLGFRRAKTCWVAFFTQRHQVEHAIKLLGQLGWHHTAKRSAPNRRSSGIQDRNATTAPQRTAQT